MYFSKYFQNILNCSPFDSRPLNQSSWRNLIGLLHRRRRLWITGTGHLVCNVINNTMNMTVQQCIHKSMIINANNLSINFIINNPKQFKAITLTRAGNYICIHLFSSSQREAFNISVLIGTGRKGAPFMTQALRNDSFSSFSSYTLLSGLSNVWDLPVS